MQQPNDDYDMIYYAARTELIHENYDLRVQMDIRVLSLN